MTDTGTQAGVVWTAERREAQDASAEFRNLLSGLKRETGWAVETTRLMIPVLRRSRRTLDAAGLEAPTHDELLDLMAKARGAAEFDFWVSGRLDAWERRLRVVERGAESGDVGRRT